MIYTSGTYDLEVDEVRTLTYSYDAQYIERQKDCGEPGGWDVNATLRCGTIDGRLMIPMNLTAEMGAEWMARLAELATKEIGESLQEEEV